MYSILTQIVQYTSSQQEQPIQVLEVHPNDFTKCCPSSHQQTGNIWSSVREVDTKSSTHCEERGDHAEMLRSDQITAQ
jgi:hypothetical protein